MDELTVRLFMHLGVGAKLRKGFTEFFGSAEKAMKAGLDGWRFYPGITDSELKRLRKTDEAVLSSIVRQCDQNDWHIVTEDSPDYPAGLLSYEDRPSVLFVSGEVSLLHKGFVCVSGTRKMNETGKAACERAAQVIAQSDRLVLSFAMHGCDAYALSYAMASSPAGVATAWGLAVRPSSADNEVIEKAAGNGVVISLFPPTAGASLPSFHTRNRFTAELCDAAVITQTDENGNSLHVASQFIRLGKPVFAFAGSPGCDRLLNESAYVLRSPLDGAIKAHYESETVEFKAPAVHRKSFKKENKEKIPPETELALDNLSQNAIIVYNILKQGSGVSDTDSLILQSGLCASDVLCCLTELELFGIIEMLPGGRYVLRG